MVPRVEELDDGLHWFTDGQDAGMWNGVGPGFGKYEKGRLARVDKMHDVGFYSGPYWEVGLPGRNNTSMIVGYRRGMSCRGFRFPKRETETQSSTRLNVMLGFQL